MNRNVPLARGTGLTRTPFPPRSSELARTPWARTVPALPESAATRRSGSATGSLVPAPPSEFTPKVKALVRKRAGNGDPFEAACEACGRGLGKEAGELQHRAARGAGGCKDAVINGPANCAFMCPPCHRRAEARDAHLGMKWAGFWIKHGTTAEYDPRAVPILLASPHGSGIKVWLAEDGIGLDGTGYLLQRPELELAS